MELSVIVPAYNESAVIEGNVLAIEKAVSGKVESYEIIVVDDGSTDATFENASRAAKSKKIMIFGYRQNKGKGYALKLGTRKSSGKIVAFLDADLEIPADRMFTLLPELEKGADIAIFSKNHPSSRINFPFYRKFLSKLYYIFAKALFHLPVSDTQTGCKVFRREVLDKVLPYVYTKQFAFDLELLAYANDYGYRISELPIKINFRRETGRIRLGNIWRMALDTLIAFFRLHVKRIHRWPADKI